MAAAEPQADDAILVVDDIVVRYETPDGPITAVDNCLLYTSRCV